MQIHRFTRKICLTFAAAAVGLSSSLSPAQNDRDGKEIKPIPISRLIGMKVENPDGQEFGKLRNLALDLRTGRIQYAIVASGGFLGVRPRLRAVPPHLLSAATAKRDTLALKLALSDWNRAPSFRLSELPALSRPEQRQAINEYYRQANAESPDKSDSGNGALMRTGRDAGEQTAARPAEMILAGDLIGGAVRDRAQQRLGEIVDVLVVLDERVPALAILSGGTFFKDRDRHYAVSLRVIHRDRNGKWALNVDRAALDRAPVFTGSLPHHAGENGSREELFQYYERK
jgi:uncharacterized protein YrrD